jgi:TonB family protein
MSVLKTPRSDVELSFDIDKTGQPINIKVTRSSQCKECDDEAIRLLKEGPKWKRKGKEIESHCFYSCRSKVR